MQNRKYCKTVETVLPVLYLLAREDLDEPVNYNPDRWSGPSPIQG